MSPLDKIQGKIDLDRKESNILIDKIDELANEIQYELNFECESYRLCMELKQFLLNKVIK